MEQRFHKDILPDQSQRAQTAAILATKSLDCRELVSQSMSRLGMTVRQVGSCDELREAATIHHPLLLIIDIHFAGRDCRELLRLVQPSVSVVFLTRIPMSEEIVDAIRAGATDVLSTPPDVRRLEGLIREILDRSIESAGRTDADRTSASRPTAESISFDVPTGVPPPLGLSSRSDLTPMQRSEYAAIVGALRETDGHVVQAAELLGVGHATVYRKIKKYGIDRHEVSGFEKSNGS
jgi:DNA-binding NtrC family response regulator